MPDTDFTKLLEKCGIDVSHETIEKLELYDHLLVKWQKAINLVGPATIDERSTRHFLDSIQIFPLIENKDIRLVDLGSGAGFPGLVLAILGMTDVHLIESDIRKCTFLREVSRETNTAVIVHDRRIDATTIENVGLVTARALATVTDLFGHAQHLAGDRSIPDCLFLKGAKAEAEIKKAEKKWVFEHTDTPSITESDAHILYFKNISPK